MEQRVLLMVGPGVLILVGVGCTQGAKPSSQTIPEASHSMEFAADLESDEITLKVRNGHDHVVYFPRRLESQRSVYFMEKTTLGSRESVPPTIEDPPSREMLATVKMLPGEVFVTKIKLAKITKTPTSKIQAMKAKISVPKQRLTVNGSESWNGTIWTDWVMMEPMPRS